MCYRLGDRTIAKVCATNLALSVFFLSLSLCLSLAQQPNAEVSRSHAMTHTVGRTPLDEGSAHRRDLYLTTHDILNTCNKRNIKTNYKRHVS